MYFIAADPELHLNADSYSYYGLADNIRHSGNPAALVSDYRTPGYPLLLAAAMRPDSALGTALSQPDYGLRSVRLLFIQTVMGIATAGLTFYLLSLFPVPAWIRVTCALIVATNTSILFWEHHMMAEALASFLVAATVSGWAAAARGKRIWGVAVAFAAGTALVFTKPMFVGFPVLLLLSLGYAGFSSAVRKAGIVCGVVIVLLVAGYVGVNRVLNGYGGFTHTADVNMLGRILELELPATDSGDPEPFAGKVREYQREVGDTQPYRFMEWMGGPLVWEDKRTLNELAAYTNAFVRAHPVAYFSLTLKDVPMVLTNSGVLPLWFSYDAVGGPGILTWLAYAHDALRISWYVLFVLPVLAFAAWITGKGTAKTDAYLICVLSIAVWYLIGSTAAGSYNDLTFGNGIGRLLTPAIPVVYAALCLAVPHAVTGIRNLLRH